MAKEPKKKEHDDTQFDHGGSAAPPGMDFPAFDQAAFDILLAAVTGSGGQDAHCVLWAAWKMSGYVLGTLVEHPELARQQARSSGVRAAVASASTEAKVRALEHLRQFAQDGENAQRPAGASPGVAIPWSLIWQLIQSIVEQFLDQHIIAA